MSDLQTFKNLILSNKLTEFKNNYNTFLIKKNNFILEDLFIFANENKKYEFMKYLIKFNELFLYSLCIRKLDYFTFKDIFNIEAYVKYFKTSKNNSLIINHLESLLATTLFLNKKDVFICIYNKFKEKHFFKKRRKNNFLASEIEMLFYTLPFIYKSKFIIKHLPNKKFSSIKFIKKIVQHDNNKGEILEFIAGLEDDFKFPYSEFNKRVKNYLIKKGRNDILNIFFKYLFTYDELVKIIISKQFDIEYIKKCIDNSVPLSESQKKDISYHLIRSSQCKLACDLFCQYLLSDNDLINCIINLQSFDKLEYFLKKSNYDYKNKCLDLDQSNNNLNYKFVEKVTNKYGYHHLRNISSIVYTMGIKQFNNNLDFLIEKYDISIDKYLIVKLLQMGININILHKLIKYDIYIPPNIILNVLDNLIYDSDEEKELNLFIILSYLVYNDKGKCYFGNDTVKEIGQIIENLNYYGKEEAIMFLKIFLKNTLITTKKNLIKDSKALYIYQGQIDKYKENDSCMCVICQQDIVKDDIIYKLNCGHSYHNSCIQQYFIYNKSCPLCDFYHLDLEI
ncbi:hypothetical protein CPAV1605_1100 [seawater metagenome]|uniref:RING-type E3 ubiquitin transferase n=1 Tax=seawater metagenome TaxID=1561972 RepID=A0A5E8CKU3_9ZZZZ